jgi:isochorismate pyruvate lyase
MIKGADMIETTKLPPMETMKDVREQVDRIDGELIALMKQRFACMDAAARIKQDRATVRDEGRKAEVLSHVKQLASTAGIPVPTMAAIWEMLIETSISYELEKWDQLRES